MREVTAMLTEECAPRGASFSIEKRTKHQAAVLAVPGRGERRVFFPSTASDWRALKNMRRDVRKVFREWLGE